MASVAARAQVSYTGTSANQNFGSQAIGTASAAQTLNFSIAAGTTVGSIAAVTQGAANLDFTEATGSTCVAQDYTLAATCTVNVTFTPRFAGLRSGAVVFYSSVNDTGTVLGMGLVYGVGTGPQVTFHSGAQTSLSLGVPFPLGSAVDASGNVFAAGGNPQRGSKIGVYEILAAGGYTTVNTLGSGFVDPGGVAVDGSGNLFVADPDNNRVLKLDYADAPALSFAITAVDTKSTDSPQTVQVQNVGNEQLVLTGVNYPTDFSEDAGEGPDACNGSTSLSPGQECDLNIDFIPQSLGVFSENVTVTDNTMNVAGTQQSIGVSGTGGTPVASLSAPGIAFGNVYLYDNSPLKQVTLTNTGGSTLIISSIGVTGAGASQFAFSNNCPTTMAINASCTIQGYFKPLLPGPFTASISIADNAGGSPQTVALTGTSVPTTVSQSATSLAYGYQQVGTNGASQQVTLTNTGGTLLDITGFSVTGPGASSFVFVDGCANYAVNPGQSCSIHGHFTPVAPGLQTATITITDDASGSPLYITLSGTGYDTTTVSLSTASVSFGNQEVGTTSASQSVTLTNSGGSPLLISSIGVTGSDSSSFVFANSCGKYLAAGANCTIHGHFTPAAEGALAAAVIITSLNTNRSPQTITLTGTGNTPPAVSLSATSIVFGTENVESTSASQSMTLTNTGGSKLVVTSIAVTGANASSLIFANSCGTSLAAGANCLIHGHFTPTLTGPLTAAVTITDNATGSPQTITLTGTGH